MKYYKKDAVESHDNLSTKGADFIFEAFKDLKKNSTDRKLSCLITCCIIFYAGCNKHEKVYIIFEFHICLACKFGF